MKAPPASGGVSGSPRIAQARTPGFETATVIDGEITPTHVSALAVELRSHLRETLPVSRIAFALGQTCDLWRNGTYESRRETVAAIAAGWGWSEGLLDESLDALLAPMSLAALESLGQPVSPRRSIVGLILPGNVPGAGMHEVAAAMLAGCALMAKTATTEPFFFARFVQTLREVDAEVGARIAVLNWSRDRDDITRSLRLNCDWIAAFGNDETIANLDSTKEPAASEPRGTGTLMARFGARFSGALVAAEVSGSATAIPVVDALARDISLFEQQGCLSPHHVFVESTDSGAVAEFARDLARALERFAQRVPPPRRYGLEEAAAVRRVRETARWRELGGQTVALMDGEGLGWTLVFDDKAPFTISPGYRTVTVSRVIDLEDLRQRLLPVEGRIEAFAIASPAARHESLRAFLASMDICYLCDPGAMQSPPLDWSHGGGVFMRALATSR
jgi:hypothetical protein